MFLVRVHSVVRDALFLHLRGHGNNLLAYGVAGKYDAVGGEELLHSFIGYADASGFLGQDLVGQSGETVLLLYEGGNALARGCPEQGSAGVSAHSDGYVGFEVLDYARLFVEALDEFEGDLDVVLDIGPVQLALESDHGQAHDGIARRGHFLHLHLAVCAHEKYLGVRVEFLELVCNGYGREDVSSRASSADYCTQWSVFHILIVLIRIHPKHPVLPVSRRGAP